MKKIIMLLTVMASAMILAGCAHQCGCNAPAESAPAHQDYKGEVSNTK